ncbi:MAG: nucleoside hydrolase [Clostridia bacterium]|nr:nucleoside hydrolase [Clostridia bacterium]
MEEKKPIQIILDTDIGWDCDDAGALALIHRLCDKGEAKLLAVTHCYNSPYCAGCIDAINRFYGCEVPIGINFAGTERKNPKGVYAGELCEKFPNSYPANSDDNENGPADTLEVLRKTLADAEDGSITLVVTGTLTSMARLVMSKADVFSSLSGKELIAKKVKRTVVMGGRFFESWPMVLYESGDPTHHMMTWEYNIKGSGYEDATAVFENWPGELVLSSYEIGSYIVSMVGYAKRAKVEDPVAWAYQVHNGDTGRPSWDHTAVLEAIRPGTYWNYHEFGQISVDEELITHWNRNSDFKHSYLLPKVDYKEIQQVIDDLIDGR